MIWQDIKYGARLLVRRPAFTIVAIVTLALGIGANTAIFSLVHGVLLKPLPFNEPDRLVQLWETNPLRNWTNATASPANLLDWRARNRVFEEIAFYPGMDDRRPMLTNGNVTATAAPERVRGLQVSANFFRVLGVSAAAGRTFADDEQVPGRQRVAVLQQWIVGTARTPLLVFLGAVSLVLLVACANLANLLLASAAGRRREFAVRSALGGAGWRLARQLLTESALLAVCGGMLGVVLARWALELLVALGSADLPRLSEVAMDGRMLAFVAALTSATTLLFGLAPAWYAAHSDVTWLRDGSRTTPASRTTRRALVIAQIAASVALVVCAGLLLRSFERLQSVPPGFDPDDAVAFRVVLPGPKYGDDVSRAVAFFEDLLVRVRGLPGVAAAGASSVIGLNGQGWTGDLFVDGRPDVWGRELRHKEVTPGYFAAMGLRLVRGRDFAASDGPDASPVVVVNEALARAYFANEDPIGRRIAFSRRPAGQPPAPWFTIVGVAQDEKQNALDEEVAPEVYETHRQHARLGMTVVVRSTLGAAALVPALRAELGAVDPAVAMFDVRTLREVVTASLARERFTTWIVGLFAALALTIAAIGLYGVIAHSVSARTREIGVRVALGATRGDVTRLVIRETIMLLVAGLALGVGLSAAGAGAIRTLLFETPPTDPVTYAAVVALLSAASLLASWVPVRRALAVDPNTALRYD